MKLVKLQILALAGMTLIAACAQTDETGDAPADSLAQAGDTAAAMPNQPIVTDLDDVNDSGISGEATATHSAQDVTVSILLKDRAKPDVTYPAHIHTGTCKDGGPVAVELEPVKNLQSSKTVATSALPANQSAFIQVHDASGKPVACGDMQGHGDGRATGDSTQHTTTH